jgi:hypothetical protein
MAYDLGLDAVRSELIPEDKVTAIRTQCRLAGDPRLWRFTRPIRDLNDAARRISSGDFDFDVTINRRDEMGTLARTFNEMRVRSLRKSWNSFAPRRSNKV